MLSITQQAALIWAVYNAQERHNKYWYLLFLALLMHSNKAFKASNYYSKKTKLTKKQENKLHRDYENMIRKDSKRIEYYIEEHLHDTYIKTWNAMCKGLEANTMLPAHKDIYANINKVWIGEKNFKQRQAHNTQLIIKKLKKILDDDTLTLAEKELRAKKVIIQYRNMVKRLVRTETIHTIGQASIRCMLENNIDEVIWITCEDERTCKICGARDKRIYPIDIIPQYPDHPNCRCLLLPYSNISLRRKQ